MKKFVKFLPLAISINTPLYSTFQRLNIVQSAKTAVCTLQFIANGNELLTKSNEYNYAVGLELGVKFYYEGNQQFWQDF